MTKKIIIIINDRNDVMLHSDDRINAKDLFNTGVECIARGLDKIENKEEFILKLRSFFLK